MSQYRLLLLTHNYFQEYYISIYVATIFFRVSKVKRIHYYLH